MCNLHKILAGVVDDYAIFYNNGECPVDIWSGEMARKIVEEYRRNHDKVNMKAFVCDVDEVVLFEPVLAQRWINWVDDREAAIVGIKKYRAEQDLLEQLNKMLANGMPHETAIAWYNAAREELDSRT
jgi:hypothetical protein